MKKIIKVTAVLLTSAAIVSMPIFSASAATTANTTITATVGSVISLTTDSNNLQLNLNPSVGGTATETVNQVLTVNTNNSAGYNLTVKGSGQLSKGSNSINAVSGTTALSANTWGYKTTGSNYTGVVSSEQNIKSTSSVANNDTTTLVYGAMVDSSLPSGDYSGTVTYTAIAK